ncbi:hypothetical protein BDD43_0481 [Mucilaginibacter gracilis]|uniref:Uncharacterized protein n=1 Tax=Mucilaginibacter gracilis TaxID=423350 RepID=A0A495IUK5_9SPHI|nr:hypothetical protein [Mucilaginibacter gracilis]RKR80380.1 hypothetical protein BDD43_0481 [Mucilaginibacter gracilis]
MIALSIHRNNLLNISLLTIIRKLFLAKSLAIKRMRQQINRDNYTATYDTIDGHIYISSFIRWIDIAVFKVVMDYIVRNFDPAGINIGGLIDSLYYVLIKPKLASFYKILHCGMNCYRENN